MESLKIAYESLAVGVEIALQKLWMLNLPPLNLIGGPVHKLVCIVTGPTSGIGKETATEVARRGAHVILACRSIPRGEALKSQIEAEAAAQGAAHPSLEVMELDLSSLESVRRFAASWAATGGRPINILINNAGIFSMSAPRSETPDGFEAHIGTNHLGHFLLTLLLLPYLKNGAKNLGRPSRVVNVSSRLHLMGRIRKNDPNVKNGYTSLAAYAQSKLANVCFAAELTRRCADGDIIAVAVHPGEVATEVVRSLPGPIQKLYNIVMGAILLSPPQGARSSVYCATSPDLENKVKNVYYFDSNCAPGTANPETKDPEVNAWLWKWSAEAVKLKPAEDL